MRSMNVLGAALALTAGSLTLAGQASAAVPTQEPAEVSTMSCSHSWSNKDDDYGYVDTDWLMRRSGPHTSCSALGQAAEGTKIYYHCYVGSFPNSWTHGRIAGTNQYGWFNDPYLSDLGTAVHC